MLKLGLLLRFSSNSKVKNGVSTEKSKSLCSGRSFLTGHDRISRLFSRCGHAGRCEEVNFPSRPWAQSYEICMDHID